MLGDRPFVTRLAGWAMAPALLAIFFVLYRLGETGHPTWEIITAVLVVTFFCVASAIYFLGSRWALTFFVIASVIGWSVEQIGVKTGLPFGVYKYTTLLGPPLGEVPCVIPLMWFNLTFLGYILVNLMIDHYPIDLSKSVRHAILLSVAAAFVITAYNLPNDPYMVWIEAWTVPGTGSYFGIDYMAFVGWALTSFAVVFLFRLAVLKFATSLPPPPGRPRRHWLWSTLPIIAYGSFGLYFTYYGQPVETRVVAPVAMGFPVLGAFVGWLRWDGEVVEHSLHKSCDDDDGPPDGEGSA